MLHQRSRYARQFRDDPHNIEQLLIMIPIPSTCICIGRIWHNIFSGAFVISRRPPELHPVEGRRGFFVGRLSGLNPNLSEAWRTRGWISMYVARHEPAIEQFHHAMRLNPLDPRIYNTEAGLAFANLFLRRFEIALSWATKSLARHKSYGPALRAAMVCYAMLGRISDAQMMLARMREAGDDLTISRAKRRMPYQRREDIDLWLEAFRLAGVPE
jgi:tetratricopeptide (TPR) repeat protein